MTLIYADLKLLILTHQGNEVSDDFGPRLFWTGDFGRQSVISDGVRWNRTVISDSVR